MGDGAVLVSLHHLDDSSINHGATLFTNLVVDFVPFFIFNAADLLRTSRRKDLNKEIRRVIIQVEFDCFIIVVKFGLVFSFDQKFDFRIANLQKARV
jgi:hypothetical protein